MKKSIVFSLFILLYSTAASAQIEVRTEAQASVASGDHTPLWLNANKYGLSSLKCHNGYVRAGAFRSIDNDSTRKWAWGAALDLVGTSGYTSKAVVQQAYGELRWLKGLLTVGSKEQPMELKNQELSSGAQTLGINARPVPSVRLSLPDYWTVPYTRGWLGIKGHIAYGMQTDDKWQKEFTYEQSKYTEHAKLHTKAGYLRIGKDDKPVSVELGLEMACQYGGTSYADFMGIKSLVKADNEDGVKGMIHAFIPGGGDAEEGIYENKSGNTLGSYVMRVNMDFKNWYLGIYADHFFEDHSQMFFLDYDGYGQGAEFNEWKESRWFVYDLKDILLGVELKLKNVSWLNNLVVEYIYTKYQSGPIYHDRTQYLSDHVAGRDEYYNNYIQNGWQHWGQVMGNPLYRSPLYNTDSHHIRVASNRFWAWHVGVSGNPVCGLHYRLLASWQRSWGSYQYPFLNPERNTSLLAEAEYRFASCTALKGWSVKGAFGMDHGGLLGNNVGGQLTVAKRFNINKK